jgi:hypothetical protein
MPWWAGKDKIKEYLEKVNENGKVRMPSLLTLSNAPTVLNQLGLGPRVQPIPTRSILGLSRHSVQNGQISRAAQYDD